MKRAVRLTLVGAAAGAALITGVITWIALADAQLDRGQRTDQGDWSVRDVNRRSSLW